MPSGKAAVASDAAFGDWFRPMKKNEMDEMVGSPPMSPPIPL